MASDSLDVSINGGVNRYLRFDAGGAKTTVDVLADLASNGGSGPVLAAMVDVDTNIANSYSCAIRFDAGTYALVHQTSGSYASLAADSAAAPELPDTYRIRAKLDATGMSCDIKRGTEDHPLTYAVTPSLTGVAVRVRDIDATIHYVAIYTSP